VLAFSDQTDYLEMAGDVMQAFYTRGQLGEPSIVLPLRVLQHDPESVAHELAHYLSFFLFPVQPRWFTEGLAEWVQTVAARPADTAVTATGSHITRGANLGSGATAGTIPYNLVSWLRYDARPMPVRELFSWDGGETATSGARGHLWSWVLFHWLWNQRSRPFAEYQKRLGERGDPEAAWRSAFPEFDPSSAEAMAKLDSELDRYRTGGRFVFYKVQAEADMRFTEETISSADLHLLMIALRQTWPADADRRRAAQRPILDEAVAEDPGNPLAQFVRMELDKKVDVAMLRTMANARPADWRGWFALGTASDGAEKEAVLRKAVQLNPENALVQNNLAWLLVTSDRARDALPIANRALDLAPWDASIVDTLAEVAARLGKCAEARQLEKRAVATARRDMRQRQAEIERRCSATK
jgi:Flp pilus assembly protein TadD